jgi:hypothetical protein
VRVLLLFSFDSSSTSVAPGDGTLGLVTLLVCSGLRGELPWRLLAWRGARHVDDRVGLCALLLLLLLLLLLQQR